MSYREKDKEEKRKEMEALAASKRSSSRIETLKIAQEEKDRLLAIQVYLAIKIISFSFLNCAIDLWHLINLTSVTQIKFLEGRTLHELACSIFMIDLINLIKQEI